MPQTITLNHSTSVFTPSSWPMTAVDNGNTPTSCNRVVTSVSVGGKYLQLNTSVNEATSKGVKIQNSQMAVVIPCQTADGENYEVRGRVIMSFPKGKVIDDDLKALVTDIATALLSNGGDANATEMAGVKLAKGLL